MRRRSVILALAGILVVSIVTPVLGHSRHAGVDLVLERAKKAKRIAKNARASAQDALALAQQASQRVDQLQGALDSECSCGGEAEFQNRVLRVGPRL